MKKISIIVPIYNMESRLDKCLDSLENQTLKDIEIILINDGSSDNSIKIIKKHMKQYPNLYKLIDRENRGISASRNEGLKLAKSEFIGFVDSDDYIELSMYEKLYNCAINNNADIVICGYKKVNNIDEVISLEKLDNIDISTFSKNPKLVHEIDYGPWNKLIKRKLFNNIEFPLNTKYEDLSTMLKVFKIANNICGLNECLYNYFINDKGETKIIDNRVYDIFKIIEDIIKAFENDDSILKKEIDYLCISKLMDYTELISSSKNKELALSFYKDSLDYLKRNINYWKSIYLLNNNKDIKKFILKFMQINKYFNIVHIKIKSN